MLTLEDLTEPAQSPKPRRKTRISENADIRVIATAGRMTVGEEWQNYKILTPIAPVRELTQPDSRVVNRLFAGDIVEGHRDGFQLDDRTMCLRVRYVGDKEELGYITQDDRSTNGKIRAELMSVLDPYYVPPTRPQGSRDRTESRAPGDRASGGEQSDQRQVKSPRERGRSSSNTPRSLPPGRSTPDAPEADQTALGIAEAEQLANCEEKAKRAAEAWSQAQQVNEREASRSSGAPNTQTAEVSKQQSLNAESEAVNEVQK